MKKLYLITGATGHVGNVLVDELKRRHESIRILVHHKQRDGNLPEGVDVCFGDVTDRESLLPFYNCAGFDHVTLVHCAAFIRLHQNKIRGYGEQTLMAPRTLWNWLCQTT